ncbi:ADP-ribosylglycohydrolase [Entamoeba marina]
MSTSFNNQMKKNKSKFLAYAKSLEINFSSNFDEKSYRLSPSEADEYVKMNHNKCSPLVPSYPSPLPNVFIPLPILNKRDSFLKDRLVGMFLGQAVADAVGFATERLTKDEVDWYYGSEIIDYGKILPDKHRIRWMSKDMVAADWTDDTDQAILILDSIVRNNGKINVLDFAKRAYFWAAFGFPEVGDIVGLGYGGSFSAAVHANNFLVDPINSTKQIWIENNKYPSDGGVMRTSAVLASGWDNVEELVKNAKKICSVTHADPRCLVSVEVIVRILKDLLDCKTNIEDIIGNSVSFGKQSLKNEEHIKQFNEFTTPKTLKDMDLCNDRYFTFKPVGCAIWALKKAHQLIKTEMNSTKIFENIIMDIIREGGDADTNAAVSGAVIGCYLGQHSIPDNWLKLKNLKWYINRINGVLKLHQLPLM